MIGIPDYPKVRVVGNIHESCRIRRKVWPWPSCPTLPLEVKGGSEVHIYTYFQVGGWRLNAIPVVMPSVLDGAHTTILKLDWGRPDRLRVASQQACAITVVACRFNFLSWGEQVCVLFYFQFRGGMAADDCKKSVRNTQSLCITILRRSSKRVFVNTCTKAAVNILSTAACSVTSWFLLGRSSLVEFGNVSASALLL